MNIRYETDVAAWATEQASFLRAGRLDQLDLAHIAEEIEDVAKSEQRELARRMAGLVMHLIRWQSQPSKRSASWSLALTAQRRVSARRLEKAPSLAPLLVDPEWIDDVWVDAKALAEKEAGIDRAALPEACPWRMADVLTPDWLPG